METSFPSQSIVSTGAMTGENSGRLLLRLLYTFSLSGYVMSFILRINSGKKPMKNNLKWGNLLVELEGLLNPPNNAMNQITLE